MGNEALWGKWRYVGAKPWAAGSRRSYCRGEITMLGGRMGSWDSPPPWCRRMLGGGVSLSLSVCLWYTGALLLCECNQSVSRLNQSLQSRTLPHSATRCCCCCCTLIRWTRIIQSEEIYTYIVFLIINYCRARQLLFFIWDDGNMVLRWLDINGGRIRAVVWCRETITVQLSQ